MSRRADPGGTNQVADACFPGRFDCVSGPVRSPLIVRDQQVQNAVTGKSFFQAIRPGVINRNGWEGLIPGLAAGAGRKGDALPGEQLRQLRANIAGCAGDERSSGHGLQGGCFAKGARFS
jgi:hypothetical protein